MLFRFFRFLSIVSLCALFITACGGGGGGGGTTPPDDKTTTVTGRVTLSSSIASGKPDVARSEAKDSGTSQRLAATSHDQPLAGATVEMYDADRIEYSLPISSTITAADGSYTLASITNVNEGSGHTVGADIPAGNYTVLAYKTSLDTATFVVAIQPFVKNFSGEITGNDLVAQDSDATPAVTSMLGQLKVNDQGVYGGTSFEVANNAAIQVTFNMAMARTNLLNALSIQDSTPSDVPGTWKISPDLQTVTFYPQSDTSIVEGQIYTITLANSATNLYGTQLATSHIGRFIAAVEDTTPPNASREEPSESTNVAVSTKIKIKANELLDINTFVVASNPSIGDKPTVLYEGVGTDTVFPYIYEIVPNDLLQLNTDYSITVSGAEDMAGNPLPSTPMNFKTTAVADTTPPNINASPVSGTYSDNIAVVLTSNENGSIFYTTDGSTPDSNSTTYTRPIPISDSTTLKFFGIDAVGNASSVKTESYTINQNCVLNSSTLGNCTLQ